MAMTKDPDCLFCKIIDGEEPSVKVWENQSFLAILNKYPKAPVHILVMPKEHRSKLALVQGKGLDLYQGLMEAVYEVVREKGMDKRGYKLVNNGGGYNHFDHEHIHVMGGSETEPGGET